jgi:hypothetical protein
MAVNLTLYISNEDDANLYERAKLLSGNLSVLVPSLLRDWLEQNDPDARVSSQLRKLRSSPNTPARKKAK